MKATDAGVKRILKAFTYSYAGFISAFRSEAAFRQDLVVFIAGTIAAVLMPVEMTARALLISSLILILLMELVNTGLETVIDRISEEYHILFILGLLEIKTTAYRQDMDILHTCRTKPMPF